MLIDFLYIFKRIINLFLFQRGNVVLVDTPGIGDSDHLRQILEEYIPKAVAFVFIVDVSRAGGLQKDRV